VPAFAEMLDRFFYDPDEEVSGSFRPAPGVDEMTLVSSEESAHEYLAFQLANEIYAVPLREVREIVKIPRVTEIPRGPDNLVGVIKLRGELLPVYDIKVRLRLCDHSPRIAGEEGEAPVLPKGARILLFREDDGDVGVLVDAVREVVRLKPSSIESLAPGVGSERDCLRGLGHLGDELFILVDVHQALS